MTLAELRDLVAAAIDNGFPLDDQVAAVEVDPESWSGENRTFKILSLEPAANLNLNYMFLTLEEVEPSEVSLGEDDVEDEGEDEDEDEDEEEG